MHGYTEVLFVSALFVHMGYIRQLMVICAVRIFALFLLLYFSERRWLHPSTTTLTAAWLLVSEIIDISFPTKGLSIDFHQFSSISKAIHHGRTSYWYGCPA